ncbi:protein kinase [Actinomadura sp. 21ATH]|uniref:serine/threonine-protein kinase n=1 Tax=Actinomadura sp. 21ATH TaxID=1735444 RepID=UPI0035C0C8E5
MGTPGAAGRHRIDRLLGSGGFASVWLGHDAELDSPVAVKILADHWALREDVRERFVREARLLRQVDSHLLVQVFDIGELDDGRPYFVMTYADRGNLEERLAAEPPPLNEALRLAREITEGVRALHERGIVHRDLKPSNVLIRSVPGGGERIMLSDLGIARTEDHLSSLTLPAGSPGYMAPEQARIDGAPDRRSDVYGLGALTYHLLTGEPPGASRPGEPAAVPAPPSRARPEVPPSVDEAVLRALEADRDRRWPSAAAFGAALDRITSKVDTDPLAGARTPPRAREGRRPGRWLRSPGLGLKGHRLAGRLRVPILAGGAAVTVMVAAGGAFLLAGPPDGADGGTSAARVADPDGRLLRTDAGIPPRYRSLIIKAGSWCDLDGLSPALIAAMLAAESGFDPHLRDPAKDEYGIARWTPNVLVHWQPGGLDHPEPRPDQITPELSIPAMGRFLCYWGKDLKDLPGDPALNLAAMYRTSSRTVRKAGGVPEEYRAHAEKVRKYIETYKPAGPAGPA